MNILTIHRCTSVPKSPVANAIYFVKEDNSTSVSIYITGSGSAVIYHAVTEVEIETLIEKHIKANGRGIVTVDYLPNANEHAGELFCLAGENAPCWSDGNTWVDLAKLAIERSGGATVTDSDLAKRLRNELQFGIKLI